MWQADGQDNSLQREIGRELWRLRKMKGQVYKVRLEMSAPSTCVPRFIIWEQKIQPWPVQRNVLILLDYIPVDNAPDQPIRTVDIMKFSVCWGLQVDMWEWTATVWRMKRMKRIRMLEQWLRYGDSFLRSICLTVDLGQIWIVKVQQCWLSCWLWLWPNCPTVAERAKCCTKYKWGEANNNKKKQE